MQTRVITAVSLCAALSACADSAAPQDEGFDELAAEVPFGSVQLQAIASPAEGGSATVSVAGCESDTCIVPIGNSPVFNAAAAPGFRFVSWTGCTFAGPSASISYPPTFTNETCTASFERVTPGGGTSVTVRAALNVRGRVAISSSAGTCNGDTCVVPPGSDVTIVTTTPYLNYYVQTGFDGCTAESIRFGAASVFADGTHPTQEELERLEREHGPYAGSGPDYYWDASYTSVIRNVQSDRTCTAQMSAGSLLRDVGIHGGGESVAPSRGDACIQKGGSTYPECLLLPDDRIFAKSNGAPGFPGWVRMDRPLFPDNADSYSYSDDPDWATSAGPAGKEIYVYRRRN